MHLQVLAEVVIEVTKLSSVEFALGIELCFHEDVVRRLDIGRRELESGVSRLLGTVCCGVVRVFFLGICFARTGVPGHLSLLLEILDFHIDWSGHSLVGAARSPLRIASP